MSNRKGDGPKTERIEGLVEALRKATEDGPDGDGPPRRDHRDDFDTPLDR